MSAARSSPRLTVLLIATLASGGVWLIATTVSYQLATATIPLDWLPYAALISATPRWRGIPAEFFLFAWSAAAAVALLGVARRDDTARRQQAMLLTFVSALPATGAALWMSMLRPTPYLSIVGLILLATVVCVASGQGSGVGDVLRAARGVLGSPLARTSLLAGLTLTIVAGEAIGAGVRSLTPDETRERMFRRGFEQAVVQAGEEYHSPRAIRVVAYTDYQCPVCTMAMPGLAETFERFTKNTGRAVELVVRDYPLESECNSGRTDALHPDACEAAAALRLIRRAKGDAEAEKFASWMYENNQELKPSVDRRLAELGLAEDYAREYQSLLGEIADDARRGVEAGVRGTPAIFVNGKNILTWRRLELALRIEHERLSQASRAASAE